MTEALLRFIGALPRDGWEVRDCGDLRRSGRCPIEVAANAESVYSVRPEQVALTGHEFEMVMMAADHEGQDGLRAALLAHVGLEEVA